ncbi:gamma-glutamyltransferase [candidate division KSB1 bacterium]|nr:gamma-glutamyltransferase [candidate division KSB1 bacterium]
MRKLLIRIILSTHVLILGLNSVCFSASRYPAVGQQGMVVTSHELATDVGLEILNSGGNAVDAAVGVGFALAVVFPTAGNLGGGGFMVIHFPDGESTTIDFREKAPLKAYPEMYLDDTGEVIPDLSLTGYLASGVPGTVAGLAHALDKYGTLSLEQVMAPAIAHARNGFPVSRIFSQDLERNKSVFQQFPASAKKFLKKDGQPYRYGEIFKQPDLARTLQTIAKRGATSFYRGEIARLIARDMQKNGGIIGLEDLKAYQAIERPPVTASYGKFKIISMGPPSSGGVAIIQSLNMLETFDLKEMGYHSSTYVHVLAEVLKRAFFDRAMYLGDPDFIDVPIKHLIDKDYAAELVKTISYDSATAARELSQHISPVNEGDHTTHYSVVDKNLIAVSVTTTINTGYGSKVVIKDAGFLMNNEMDDFAVKPGEPNIFGLVSYNVNEIQPGKRMLSSMSPTIVTLDDKVYMTVGSMGGPAIITAVLQIILNHIEFEMDVQEAVDAPRIHHQWLPDVIQYETYAFPKDVQIRLEGYGHRLQRVDYYHSEAHAIRIDDKGWMWGAGDPRFEGEAKGY